MENKKNSNNYWVENDAAGSNGVNIETLNKEGAAAEATSDHHSRC